MIVRHNPNRRRQGIAAVEAALVISLVMAPMMVGVWEVGRLVYAQQVVANAAREGCRIAAQAKTINTVGASTVIMAGSQGTALPSQPNVWDTVYQSLCTGGLPGMARTDVTTTFAFIDPPTNLTDPYQGSKGQRFRVTVSIPFAKAKLINIGLINPTTVYYQADWQILTDNPFTINSTIPTW